MSTSTIPPAVNAGSGLLTGKVAAITGGGRGIGAAVARRYAEQGATVLVADIDGDAAEETAAAIAAETGARVAGYRLDVTDEAALDSTTTAWVEEFGRLDCVVANAGILYLAHVVDTTTEGWKRTMDVNLTGVFLTVRAAGRRMLETGGGGSIIIASSELGVRGLKENGAYAAAKFGVVGLAQCMATEVAPQGVRVNCVCPGQVATSMIDELLVDRAERTGTTEAEVLSALVARVPMGRMATVEEIADVYVFLASDLSRYVTGHSLVVDGGWLYG